MKWLRKLSVCVLLICFIVICAGCGSSEQTSEHEETTPSVNMSISGDPTVGIPEYIFPSGPEEQGVHYSLGRYYDTIEDLFNAADSIIIGKVCYQEFYEYKEIKNSYAQVWIEETLHGDKVAQRLVTVCEVGAKYGNGVEGSNAHVPLLRAGERVLLFLFENTLITYPWHNGCTIVGDYQGKFFYNPEDNSWYNAGLLGQAATYPDDAQNPIPDKEMRELISSMAAEH